MRRDASTLLRLAASDAAVGIASADAHAAVFRAGDPAAPDLLLYGFGTGRDHRAIVERVMGIEGALSVHGPMVGPVDGTAAELTWTNHARALAPQLAGMTLRLRLPVAWCATFTVPDGPAVNAVEPLALLNGRPWFLRVRSDNRWIYMLGIAQVPDGEVIVSSAEQELPLVSAAIALLLFVRSHYPAEAWSTAGSFGNFVIDDPLLRPSYGFLQHQELATQVQRCHAAATIAFIPWNAGRSEQSTVALYKNTPNLSVCTHGYEHIEDEFATEDAADLHWRAAHSMAGMRRHETLTGLPFEPVMVFPQGKFASGAIRALGDAGFLAAANSTFLATDRTDVVRLKDLLQPAVMAYGPMPLFRRRAPRFVERFRYDLVLGKPLILVEHHEYFSDRGRALEQVLRAVNDIAPATEWVPLGDIARRTHLQRSRRANHHEVIFYCREFRFRAAQPGTYQFAKQDAVGGVRAVTVNGRPVDFSWNGDEIRFTVALERNADLEIVVVPQPSERPTATRKPRHSRIAVAARRYLSESRDNYVVTNAHLQSCLAMARRLLRV